MPLIGETKEIVYSTQEQAELQARETERAEAEQDWIDQQAEETARLNWLEQEAEYKKNYPYGYTYNEAIEGSIDPRED